MDALNEISQTATQEGWERVSRTGGDIFDRMKTVETWAKGDHTLQVVYKWMGSPASAVAPGFGVYSATARDKSGAVTKEWVDGKNKRGRILRFIKRA